MDKKTNIQDYTKSMQEFTPLVLNAIYRFGNWQKNFFEEGKKLNEPSNEEKFVFDFFRDTFIKNNRKMPNQTGMETRWKEYIFTKKSELTNLTEDKINNYTELFEKVIWNIDESEEYINKKVIDYVACANCLDFAEKVVKMLRQEASYEEFENSCKKLATDILDTDTCTSGFKSLSEVVRDKNLNFVPTFIKDINSASNGGFPVGLSILCGITGSGKTMAVVNQLVYLAMMKIPCLHIITADLSEDEFLCRVLAHINWQYDTTTKFKYSVSQIMQNDEIHDYLVNRYKCVLETIYVKKINTRQTPQDLMRLIDNKRKESASQHLPIPNFVSIDYDSMIKSKFRTEQYADWANDVYVPLQEFAKDNGIALLMVAQTTKEATKERGEKQNGNLQMTDIKGAIDKSYTAGLVLTMTPKKTDKNAKIYPVNFSIAKGRNGGADMFVPMLFDGEHCTYSKSIAKYTNEELEKENVR